jgi:hypothetical protein
VHDYRCNGLCPGIWAHQFVSGMFLVLSGVNHQSSHVRGSFLLGSLHLSKGYSCLMQCVTHLLFQILMHSIEIRCINFVCNFISLSRNDHLLPGSLRLSSGQLMGLLMHVYR